MKVHVQHTLSARYTLTTAITDEDLSTVFLTAGGRCVQLDRDTHSSRRSTQWQTEPLKADVSAIPRPRLCFVILLLLLDVNSRASILLLNNYSELMFNAWN